MPTLLTADPRRLERRAAARPIVLPRRSGAQVRLDNLALSRGPESSLDLAGVSVAFWLGPVRDRDGAAQALSAQAAGGSWLRCGNGRLWLQLEAELFAQCLRPWIGAEALERLPPVLAGAARTAALAPLCAALTSMLDLPCDLSAAADRDGDRPRASWPLLGLWRTPEAGAGLPSALCCLDETAADELAAALAGRAPRAVAAQADDPWPDLPVELTPWLGALALTAAELRDLAPGDLLLLPPAQSASAGALLLRHRRRPLAVARLEPPLLIIDRLVSAAMSEFPSSDTDTDTALSAALDPDDLELRLDVDLGSLTLPLRELRALQPGQSLALDLPLEAPARIRVGDRVIARGELIAIDERLGVRIVALLQPAASA